MKKLFKVMVHDYMDMYPEEEMILMEDGRIKEWEKHMKETYSGGTTDVIGEYTKEEAAVRCMHLLSLVLKRPFVTTIDGSMSSVDIDYIQKVINTYREVFGK